MGNAANGSDCFAIPGFCVKPMSGRAAAKGVWVMASTYLPRKDADLLAWSQNFLDVIGVDPTLYGLTLDQANTYNDVQDAYATAYATANHSSTRTKASIETKMLGFIAQ